MNDSEKTGDKSNLAHTISPHSISVYAEAAGHDEVTDGALAFLSFNVSGMLYEILKECKTEMNAYRQTSLSNVILSNVFQNYGIPPMFGNKALTPFVRVPNTDISVLHLPTLDLVAEAAVDRVAVDLEPVPLIKGLYVSPVLEPANALNAGNVKIEPESDVDEPRSSYYSLPCNRRYTLTKKESNYFIVASQIILSPSENMFNILLEDLRSNPRIGGVYCTLLNFVGHSIRDFKCVGKLSDRLLRIVDALLDNPYFDPSSTLSVDEAIRSLCTLIDGSKIANDCDDFPHRSRASYVLMRALNIWNIDVKERSQILCRLTSTLKSPEKMSLKSNYSTLMMFHGLGCDVLDSYFWPFLDKYLNVLSSLDEIISGKRSFSLTTDICHVKSALLLLSGILYRNFWASNESVQLLHFETDKLLHTYFGEAIVAIRAYAVPKLWPLPVHSATRLPLVDVRKDYEMNSFALRKMYPTKNVPMETARSHYDMNDVFDENLLYRRNTRIIFNFEGSNQMNSEQLRVKKPDWRYNIQDRQSAQVRRPHPKFEKRTRCIKYCKTGLSFIGNMHMSL